jgi:hypothetical protein
MNPVRTRALEIMAREDTDLTDAEILARDANDDFWFVSLALESLHRLPSEVEPLLSMREYGVMQAHSMVQRAMTELTRRFQG